MNTRKPKAPATKFAGRTNLWTGAKPVAKNAPKVDVSKLVIEDTPYDPNWKKTASKSKYDAVFSQLKDGQCIAAKPEDCGAISNGMRKWFENRGFEIDVAEIRKCEDGKGRVWLMGRRPIKTQAQGAAA